MSEADVDLAAGVSAARDAAEANRSAPGAFVRLAHWVILAGGWQRRIVAFSAGAFGALAMAPFDIVPALVVPMTAAVWLIDGSLQAEADAPRSAFVGWSTLRAAAGAGWWLGLGYFLAGLWWVGAAFLVEADQFAWALPLAVIGLPAVMALYTALGFALAALLWSPRAARILALAAGLSVAEWLRGHLLTGFPWNAFGMAFGGTLVLAQSASVIGLYGLTVLAVAVFAAPATCADEPRRGRRRPFGALLAACVACAGLALSGVWRLSQPETGVVAGVNLRIMQPNLPQDAKFRPQNKDAILQHYLSLSDRATAPDHSGLADVTHLIWPESAFPFILANDPSSLARIGALLPAKTLLITGAARASRLPGETRTHYFNAVQVVASGGTIVASADKVHLVPFGEYVPLSGWLDRLGVRNLVAIPGGFDSGDQRRLLSVPGLPPASPLICYEAIFPGAVTPAGPRPGFLLNVTNDGWFGMTTGPYQHFAQARLRAVEEGLPLVRAANTGISAIIDPYGRVLAELPLGREGVLDGALPLPLAATFFAGHPLTGPVLLWVLALAGAFLARRRSG